jgi:hypothetical protein
MVEYRQFPAQVFLSDLEGVTGDDSSVVRYIRQGVLSLSKASRIVVEILSTDVHLHLALALDVKTSGTLG